MRTWDRGARSFVVVVARPSRAANEAVAQPPQEYQRLAHDIFKQLIEINTTDSVGNVSSAAEAMAKRLREAGFDEKDIQIAGPRENKKNLVVRYHGSGARKPVLFIGHLDVVEARREDWTVDPFIFLEKDGLFLRPRHRRHEVRRCAARGSAGRGGQQASARMVGLRRRARRARRGSPDGQ